MPALLSTEDAAEALKLGWIVTEVYDIKAKRMVPCVLAAGQQSWDREALMQKIATLARARATVAVNTLRVLAKQGKPNA
jgi:hypothetical protein